MSARSASPPVDEPDLLPAEDEDDSGLSLEITPRKLVLLGVVVVVAIGTLYFLLPQLAGLEDTWRRLEDGSPGWLVLGAVLTFGMFAGYVFTFHGVYREARLTWGESYQVCMAALAASRLFSAGGAGGLVLQAWALRRAGLAKRRVADRTVAFLVLQYVVYTFSVVAFGYALYFGLLAGRAPFAITFVPATLALVITVLALSVAFVSPDLQRRLSAWAAAEGSRARWLLARLAVLPAVASAGIRDALGHVRARDSAVFGAVVFWAAQIAVLWACFKAFGSAPPLAVLIVGFFVGMLGNLLPLPGGIGGVDGGMFGAFAAFGTDLGTAAVAVLAFRGFTFWLPTLPGIVAFLQLRRTVDRWRDERRSGSRECAAAGRDSVPHR